MARLSQIAAIHSDAPVDPARFGTRGARLNLMAGLGLPVPKGVVLSADAVAEIARSGTIPDLPEWLGQGLLSLRASPLNVEWGGPTAIMNIGICDAALPAISARVGALGAQVLYRRFVHSYATHIAGLDAEDFEASIPDGEARVATCKSMYEAETGEAFPQDPEAQLHNCLRHMARAWNRPTARILRQAKGAPADAGVALIIQQMALGIGQGLSGAGAAQIVDDQTGAPMLWGRYLAQSQGQDALIANHNAVGLEGLDEVRDALLDAGQRMTRAARDAMQFEFTLENGALSILDMQPAKRSHKAAVRIAVDLAEAGIISRRDALLRVDPRNLVDHLHPRIEPDAPRDIVTTGLSASPGAATGVMVFSAEAAMTAKSQDRPCILVRSETTPEDIRGIHAAQAVLTMRGGMTSHAAVIARGLGVPCIVGAQALQLDMARRCLHLPDGRELPEGAPLTIDGNSGQVLFGAVPMTRPSLDGSFKTLMEWADETRDMQVRANADTPVDARVARRFKVDGIGLCRTEHMFFEAGRLNVMRRMILAEDAQGRRDALDALRPMQQADFVDLFEIMHGLPVTIRLLDPPLHEFLPRGSAEITALAAEMGLSAEALKQRIRDMEEVNPMLGMRGVRVGIIMPEIYEMQARAIFGAAEAVRRNRGTTVVPEIMIPLVSANREVELIRARIEAVAAEMQAGAGDLPEYRLGAMVETPRAALRAGDLAQSSAFLSFGTNDLTQMTYGLSRDDAGRFMRAYVRQGVFAEDPFHSLDLEGVGELLLLAAQRGRETNPDLVLGLCGEHGGDPASIRFSKLAGFDYVSCSPFRVPIARLAAAQASILAAEPDR